MFHKLAPYLFAVLMTLLQTPSLRAQEVSDYEQGITFFDLIWAGGPVILVLILISIAVIGLAILSLQIFRRSRFVPEELKGILIRQIRERKYDEAILTCTQNETPLCQLIEPGLKKVTVHLVGGKQPDVIYTMEHVRSAVENMGYRIGEGLRGLVNWFSNLGVISPMLGLLGTVLGMIRAFGAIAYKSEGGQPLLLASAISQAMVTTAGGLIVGILSMSLFYYFNNKNNALIHELEDAAGTLCDEIEISLSEKKK